jgi:hypothetical protein
MTIIRDCISIGRCQNESLDYLCLNSEKTLLQSWDITHAQLISIVWCTITSFEKLFSEFQEIMGPTLCVFDLIFFNLVSSFDHFFL